MNYFNVGQGESPEDAASRIGFANGESAVCLKVGSWGVVTYTKMVMTVEYASGKVEELVAEARIVQKSASYDLG